jgi:hypothetical protein
MSPFSKSKCAFYVITKKRALPPLIHHSIGFRVIEALRCKTGDNCLIVFNAEKSNVV